MLRMWSRIDIAVQESERAAFVYVCHWIERYGCVDMEQKVVCFILCCLPSVCHRTPAEVHTSVQPHTSPSMLDVRHLSSKRGPVTPHKTR